MREFLKNELEKVKGLTYIVNIPIEEFQSIEELTEFVKTAKQRKCGVVLYYETSNCAQGVLVELFDKEMMGDPLIQEFSDALKIN